MGATTLGESDDEDHAVISVNANVLLRAVTEIARCTDNTEAVHILLSSLRFQNGQNHLKQLHSTTTRKRSFDETEKRTEAEKTMKVLKERVNIARKRKRLLQTDTFECDECESYYSTKLALKTHIDNKHASRSHDSNEPESPQYPCALCNKKRAGIYKHYKSVHNIDYPEQIMFYTGNVLVRSDIDTQQGKAPWFLREKVNAIKRQTNVNCRLCEGEPALLNPIMLSDHYTLVHMVDPDMLTNIERLFRAEKGAHLNVTSLETPSKRKKRSHSTLIQSKLDANNENMNDKWPCRECNGTYSNKGNLMRHIKKAHPVKKPEEVRSSFECDDCLYVYPSEELLNKHKNEKHSPKAENKSSCKSVKYECVLCNNLYTSIYKHYGNVHNIEYPEQLMFIGGRVLVFSDIDTKDGTAPWFLKEKEKAKRYTLRTCRLCDTEFNSPAMLNKHYWSDHKVVPGAFHCLQHLFRAEKGAHLADLSGLVKKVDTKMDSGKFNPEIKIQKPAREIEKTSEADHVMYQCKTCDVATNTYDASVEHAQLHFLDDYRPITETCVTCNLAFEAVCFADHVTRHSGTYRYQILKYDPSKLLSDEWFDIFQGLSESHVNIIRSSSNYQHTRRVKMNSDTYSGTALYQCATCEMFVDPENVENHCNTKNCIENESQNHYCSLCDIYFDTFVAVSKHFEEHRQGCSTSSFRKVTFKCWADTTVNVALLKLQNESRTIEEPLIEAQTESEQLTENSEGNVVSLFCDECNTSVNYTDFDAHAAAHKYQYVAVNEEVEPPIESNTSLKPTTRAQQGEEETMENPEDDDDGIFCYKCNTYINYTDFDAHADLHSNINQCGNEEDNPKIESETSLEPPTRAQQGNEQTIENPEDYIEIAFCDECNKSINYGDFDAHAASHKNSNQSDSNKEVHDQTIQTDTSHTQTCVSTDKQLGKSENIPQIKPVEGTDTVEPWNSDNDSCYSLRISSITVKAQFHSAKGNSEDMLDDQSESTTGINDANSVTDDDNEFENTQEILEAIEFNDFSDELANDLKRDLLSLGLRQIILNKASIVQNETKSTQELLEILEGDPNEPTNHSMNNQNSRGDSEIQTKNVMVVDQNKEFKDARGDQEQAHNDAREQAKEHNDVRDDISQDMFKTDETSTNSEENTNIIADVIDLTDDNDEDIEIREEQRPSSASILTMELAENFSRISYGEEVDRQSLIDETDRIRAIMSGRD